jgi:hypothetical protein
MLFVGFVEREGSSDMSCLVSLCLYVGLFLDSADPYPAVVLLQMTSLSLHLFLLGVYAWLAIEGLRLYIDLVIVVGSSVDVDQLYSNGRYAAYGVPLLIVVVSAVADKQDYYNNQVRVWRVCIVSVCVCVCVRVGECVAHRKGDLIFNSSAGSTCRRS